MIKWFEDGIDRRGTNCEKWDADFVGEGVLPMWVADMDFPIAPAITESLVKVAGQQAFGYQLLSEKYYETVVDFLKERHGYEVKKEWISFCSNVVQGMFFALQTVTEPGDEIMIQTPVYGPFFRVVNQSGRKLVESPLHNEDGFYTMDFTDMESRISEKTKALLLCNPHNPSGRVWTREELENLVAFCKKHQLVIISDDIHSDIITKGHKHTMIGSICEQEGVECITCISPSKPFNLASIHVANLIIPNAELRERFEELLSIHHTNECNAFAEPALVAAYTKGLDWLDEMCEYVEGNMDYFIAAMKEIAPRVKIYKPEGTYLVWADCRGTGLPLDGLQAYLKEKARIYVNEGEFFGADGRGFVRFNLACPRSIVEESIARLSQLGTYTF